MTTTAERSELLDDRGVAALLGCSRRFVWSLNATGRIPRPVRFSPRFVRWRRSDLQRWLAEGMPSREVFEASIGGAR